MKPNLSGRVEQKSPRPCILPALDAGSGLSAGTVILTGDGEIPVEYLSPGDRVITRNAGMVRLTAIDHADERVGAIHFSASSLGHTRPEDDIILPAQQRVLIRDWRAKAFSGMRHSLVRAGALVDGEFVRDLGLREMRLHRLYFDRPQVIYAGGLEVAGCITVESTLRRVA